MGLSAEEFYSLTPAEFYYTYQGWSALEQSRQQQAWERERWSIWCTNLIHIDPKHREDMTKMYPLPWDEQQFNHQGEITMDERRQRVKEMLNK